MTDIPFVDRLGEALEQAITPEPPRRRSWGPAAAAAAFVAVLGAGALWWAIGAGSRDPRPDPVATTTTTSATTTTTVAAPAGLPSEWGRVPGIETFAADGFATLNAVVSGPDGFFAAGSVSTGGELDRALVLASDDGVAWSELPGAGLEGGFVNDLAVGDGGRLVAVGGGMAAGPALEVWTFGGTGWAAATVSSSLPAAQANVVVFTRDGFVAGGNGYDDAEPEGPRHAVVWVSEDGTTWQERRPPSFTAPREADISALAAHDGRVVAGGLLSGAEGRSEAAVWVSDDLDEWRFVALPTDTDGFAGVAGLAAGGPGFVAVGFEAREGTAGAVWTSEDGMSWQRIPHDDGLFGGEGQSHTRIQDVTAVAGGLVAVGSESAGPDSRKVIWTSADGWAWKRIDVAGPPLLDGATVAHDVAAAEGAVVTVGGELSLGLGAAVPAAWVSPPPAGVEPDAPVVAVPPPPPPDDAEVVVTLDPGRATPATRVVVNIDGPRGEDNTVFLVGPGGEATEACMAPARGGRHRGCRFRPADIGIVAPGDYGGGGGDPGQEAGLSLEVVPPGTELVDLDGVYTPFLHPLVQQLSIRNDGDAPLDLTGWAVQASRSGTQRLEFPGGLVLEAGQVVVVFQGGPGGGECRPDEARFLYTCNYFEGGVGATAHWAGGAVVVDGAGEVRAEWAPPR